MGRDVLWTDDAPRPLRRARLGVLAVLCAAACIASLSVSPAARAAVPSPGWRLDSVASPTSFFDSQGGTYEVEVTNAGSEPSVEAEPVVISDTVSPRLAVGIVTGPGVCTTTGQKVQCTVTQAVRPDEALRLSIAVSAIEANETGPVTNEVKVTGGGAREASTSSTNEFSATPLPFGFAHFGFLIDGLNGALDSQAGGHPYELTTTIDFNTEVSNSKETSSVITSVHDLKDVVVDLPLGFAGSTLAAPQCTLAQLSSAKISKVVEGEVEPGTGCPPDTAVGRLTTEPKGTESANSPIWNLTPERGVPAEFGFVDGHENTHVFYAHVVPTSQGYVLQVTNKEIPQIILTRIVVTFYGNPAQRDDTGNAQIPFFTDPTACDGGPLTTTIYMDSWQQPASFNADGTPDVSNPNWVKATSTSPPVTGCDELQFTPEMLAQPTTTEADTPSGLDFELKLPQTEDSALHATPALRTAVVQLPAGLTVDPSAGSGLEACSEGQIGWEGPSLVDFNTASPQCPEASKIGSLELETPLVRGVLHGEMYLANQSENPFGSVFAAYVVVNDPVTGVLLKIAGELETNPQTGQITSTFAENPQLPFSDLKLHFFGGPRAELATPDSCGTFTTTSELSPWSAPGSGPNALPFASFLIDSGCVSGFAPAFSAGSTNLQAGAYTSFVASFSREDAEQELAGASVSLSPGLLANIKSVPQCAEAQANAGTCPESTQVGTVQAAAGPGPNPIFEQGKAYFTGPYNGGAYGLSVVVPAIAGPFNFGNVVVRQSLRIDPRDAHVTDVSDPFPTILHATGPNGELNGIPIRLRRVDVDVDRPGFGLNPTNCSPLSVNAVVSSINGATASKSTPFQITDCAALKFTPKLVVSTAGHGSKADGTSLSFKITYPPGSVGRQSWFNEAKFDLPVQLPSRLETLQRACLASVFEANPANCPKAATIGHAIVRTPILSAPLTGPVYFVSYGSKQFPEAVMVLQGDNITFDLHGETLIKNGVTSATFRNTPDAPFESIEVTIPKGRYSEFGINLPKSSYNLCGRKLVMPTLFKAQNGLEIHQSTKIAITGCRKARKSSNKGHAKQAK